MIFFHFNSCFFFCLIFNNYPKVFQNLENSSLYMPHSFIFCENSTSKNRIEFSVTSTAALCLEKVSQGLWTTVPSSKLEIITLPFKGKICLERNSLYFKEKNFKYRETAFSTVMQNKDVSR